MCRGCFSICFFGSGRVASPRRWGLQNLNTTESHRVVRARVVPSVSTAGTGFWGGVRIRRGPAWRNLVVLGCVGGFLESQFWTSEQASIALLLLCLLCPHLPNRKHEGNQGTKQPVRRSFKVSQKTHAKYSNILFFVFDSKKSGEHPC